MNPAAQPKQLVDQIGEQLKTIALRGGERPAAGSWEIRKLLADTDRLQSVDASMGSLLKAKVFALVGDRPSTLYWLDNATALSGNQLPYHRMLALLLLGYPEEANDFYDEAIEDRGAIPVDMVLLHLCAAGWFQRASELIEAATIKKLVFKATKWVHFAPRAAAVFGDHGLKIDDVNRIQAEMHEILREENSLWLFDAPRVSIEESFVSMRYVVDFDADKVAAMTALLTDRLSQRGLDGRGLHIAFETAASESAPSALIASDMVNDYQSSAPIFDRERMDRALAGPRFMLPQSATTARDVCAYLDSLASKVQ